MTNANIDIASAIENTEQAVLAKKLTESAFENITHWLIEPHYKAYRNNIIEHINNQDWQTLDDVFWTIIPFGTGGRRGRMYPFGTNAINHRTIGESAQGIADYVKSIKPEGPWSCGIGFDTRHHSREFAELCAGILVANAFKIYFIDDYRSTPELSFLVRYKNCDCGIMVTGSHNPPSDNAIKVYWSNGAQLIPPHDHGVIECVKKVKLFDVADFQEALDAGTIELCRKEIDKEFLEEQKKHSFGVSHNIKIIYSPLHGVGEFNVKTLFAMVGLNDLEIYKQHREPNGDFPNIPDHIANPENPVVFEKIIERAKEIGADLVLASDPDCDRMGAAAPLTLDEGSEWATFNGNQLGALLADFVLKKCCQRGNISSDHYVITTLVTTMMIKRIAQSYGIRCYNNNLVGFKWICSLIDQLGADKFLFGTEEAHGYLVGQYCRDKDGAIACMLMSELAADAKSNGMSAHQWLNQLYLKHGYYEERLITTWMDGSDGMSRMQNVMATFRESTPWQLGEHKITALKDYLYGRRYFPDESSEIFSGPKDNLIMLETDILGYYIFARPSGTEPKIKLYLYGYHPVPQPQMLEEIKSVVKAKLYNLETELRAYVDNVD